MGAVLPESPFAWLLLSRRKSTLPSITVVNVSQSLLFVSRFFVIHKVGACDSPWPTVVLFVPSPVYLTRENPAAAFTLTVLFRAPSVLATPAPPAFQLQPTYVELFAL